MGNSWWQRRSSWETLTMPLRTEASAAHHGLFWGLTSTQSSCCRGNSKPLAICMVSAPSAKPGFSEPVPQPLTGHLLWLYNPPQTVLPGETLPPSHRLCAASEACAPRPAALPKSLRPPGTGTSGGWTPPWNSENHLAISWEVKYELIMQHNNPTLRFLLKERKL